MNGRPQRRRAAAWHVAAAVLAFHAIWIAAYLGSGHDIRDFIRVGPRYALASKASTVIHYDPSYGFVVPHDQANTLTGYDGQFSYYIALDPSRAHDYIVAPDSASYRYQRILYPMLARGLALGQRGAVPWALMIINWLACGGGVLALAAWLRRRGASPWFAAVYGLFPGMIVAIQLDLTEPLAYGLVALAIYLFDFGGRRGVAASAVAFALAALTRETTLVFAILFGLSILAGRPNADPQRDTRGRIRQALQFSALALIPFFAWLAIDYSWLGLPQPGSILDPVPFAGIFADPLSVTRQPLELAFVGVPALLLCTALLPGLRRAPGRLERLCVIANTALVVVFSSGAVWGSYTSIGRLAISIALGAVLCTPYLPAINLLPQALRERRWISPATVTAFALWMALLPGALLYGFSTKRINPNLSGARAQAAPLPTASASLGVR
jgi:hypothetical protein